MNRQSSLTVRLRNLHFFAKIGVFEQERIVGNDFRVDVDVTFPASHFKPEDLSTSVSYADVYGIVSNAMKRDWLLVESIAGHICDCVLARWEFVESVRTSVFKLRAPVPGIDGECGAEIFLKKS